MDTREAVRLRCQDCGHEWEARDNQVKRRQCSKCRSRTIAQIPMVPDAVPIEDQVNEPASLIKVLSRARVAKEFEGYLDDPEVQAKIKELQLARLEGQVAEERGRCYEHDVILRIVSQQKAILRALSDGMTKNLDYLLAECPFCGKSTMRFEEVRASTWGWKCHSCGVMAE